jgi:hypothetical protein
MNMTADQIQELRAEIYQRQTGRCFVCGMPMGFTSFQLAHRIPQRGWCYKRWGSAVVDASVVGTHAECNSRAQLNPDSLMAEELAVKLRAELRRKDRRRWAR